MKYAAIAAVMIGAAMLSGCGDPVKYDEVGVKVIEMGSNAGVQSTELGTGRYMLGLNEYIVTFPKTELVTKWDEDGEGFSFLNSNGATVGAYFTLVTVVEGDKADSIVQKYRIGRGQGLEDVANNQIRRAVQTALVRYGVQYTNDDLYSVGAEKLRNEVYQEVRNQFLPDGIVVVRLEWARAVVLPQAVLDQIVQKNAAIEGARRAEAQLAVVKAEAEKVVAQAEGESRAIELRGNALRANPQVLRQQEIEKWNGVCPLDTKTCVVGSASRTNIPTSE